MRTPKILGVMSGSSADGVDFWLAAADSIQTPIQYAIVPYPQDLKAQLLGTLTGATSYQDMLRIEHAYTHFLAKVIEQWTEVDSDLIIGVHGPTVFHQGGVDSRQLVHGPMLAHLLGCTVISDFRLYDVLSGGQGAPLAPLYHRQRFSQMQKPLAIVNIGGICNVTLLDHKTVRGYDIGPGNGLMDLICQQHFNCAFDDQGHIARKGKVIENLLVKMLKFPFFELPGPKSIHRDAFNQGWLNDFEVNSYQPKDVLRTVLALTVQLILKEVGHYKSVVVIGGGAKNQFLISQIEEKAGLKVTLVSDMDYIEAQLIAWLSLKGWQQEKLDYRQVTGAAAPVLYGRIDVADF
jgi:anhydro-N-acetylmuramic acid kinase